MNRLDVILNGTEAEMATAMPGCQEISSAGRRPNPSCDCVEVHPAGVSHVVVGPGFDLLCGIAIPADPGPQTTMTLASNHWDTSATEDVQ